MANQHAMMLEAIMSIKKAVARERDRVPDSDNEAPKTTNRGNKLKRRAEYYHEGELGGRMPIKRKIEHAGHHRYILRRNPKRFDEEGFELLTDEEDEGADKEAADKNPYSGIHIEQILRPLTRASDLQNHPALSLTYKSQILPNIVRETQDMLQKERKTLVHMKALMEQLRGDAPWVPAGDFLRPDDIALFMNEKQPDGTYAASSLYPFETERSAPHQSLPVENGQGSDGSTHKVNGNASQETDISQQNLKIEEKMPSVEAISNEHANGTTTRGGDESASKAATVKTKQEDTIMDEAPSDEVIPMERDDHTPINDASRDLPKNEINGDVAGADITALADGASDKQAPPVITEGIDSNIVEISKSSNPPTPSAISSPGSSPPARMQTRAQTNAANGTPQIAPLSRSVTPDPPRPESPVTLHPLYLPRSIALPDRNVGLPPHEAEDLRRLLSFYIQKQEEVCRGADRLYQGLLRALRLRDTVWWWCRAEQHRGSMSDGEDWVDKEEWGLEEDLRKGDAVTEENAEEQGKKTRGRRVAG